MLEWKWTDKSKWSEEHWMVDEPINDREDKDYLQLVASKSTGSEWIAWFENNDTAESICQVPTKMKIRENTVLVFSSKNISTLQFKWIGEVEREISNHSNHSVIGGFRLKWHVGEVHDMSTNGRDTNWKLKSDQLHSSTDSRIMRAMLNLVREAKKHVVSETGIWNSVLKQRWNINTLNQTKGCLSDVGVVKRIIKAAQEINLTIGFDIWIPEDDLALGAQLLSAIWYCPHNMVESAKLSVFFESLLTNHSLEKVVTATMNSIQPRAGDTIQDFTAINMWYEELDRRYNFSIGPIVAALLTSEQLNQLKGLYPPFLYDVSDEIHGKDRSHTISHITGKTKFGAF